MALSRQRKLKTFDPDFDPDPDPDFDSDPDPDFDSDPDPGFDSDFEIAGLLGQVFQSLIT